MNLLTKNLPLNRSVETVVDTYLISLQNKPSPILVGPKLWEEQSFECRKTSLIRRAVVFQKMNKQKEPTQQEPMEGIKGGYCLDILVIHLDIQLNTVITLPRVNQDCSPISPKPPPPLDNVFNIHLTKHIIEHKRCRIRFQNGLYTCLISDFMNNKRAIYEFWIFEFFIFLFLKLQILAYFDPK